MKTYRNFYSQIYDFENLYQAYRAARRAKRDRFEIMRFEQRVEDNLFQLQQALREQTYAPGTYRHFYIYEPKRRKISAAPFHDRVVHHALVNLLEPIWERRFIHDSYACRVGKGTHRALNRCTEWVRQYRYVLQCDVAKFFPTIDHAILRNIFNNPDNANDNNGFRLATHASRPPEMCCAASSPQRRGY